MIFARFSLGALLGIGSAAFAWAQISGIHPIFQSLSPSGLVPPIAAGIVGGFIAGLLAPHHKFLFASVLGCTFAGAIVLYMVMYRFPLGGRNPLFWYWPAWLAPAFIVGGYLSRRFWCVAQPTVQRDVPASGGSAR